MKQNVLIFVETIDFNHTQIKNIMSEVRFNLVENGNTNKKKKFIRLSFVYGNPKKRFLYSVGSINPGHWDAVKQRAKVTRANPEYSSLNIELDDLKRLVLQVHGQYQLNNQDLTTEQLKKEIDILKGKAKREVKMGLFEFIDSYIESSKETKRPASVKVYRQTLKHLLEYQKKSRHKLTFENLDSDFSEKFYIYMVKKGYTLAGENVLYTQNFINKVFGTLKTMLKDASKKKINPNSDYANTWMKVSAINVENIYLNESELAIINNLDLSKNTRLEKVRDLFIIGAYTGLRFSDFSNIQKGNIILRDDNHYISITTKKTNTPVVIPLHPIALSILQKYDMAIPGSMSNQKMNDYLKEIGELAGIKGEIILSKTRGGRNSETKALKYELITTHTARRSFATNAYKSGIPAIAIMAITGHKTQVSFMKYIKITNEENASLLSNHSFFKGTTLKESKLKIV
jgi:integrase